jgi:glycosyltransferase involved in cell wall biosynthesis
MAAGRPLVVTPRRETRTILERHGAGVIADDDSTDALARALESLLVDETRTRALGSAAREAAVRFYNWPVVGGRVASEVLSREGSVET